MDFINKTRTFLLQSRRVWKILKRPSKEEFNAIAKVSAIGILAIGALGFGISFILRGYV